MLDLSHNFERPCDQRFLWIYGKTLLIICNHYTRFDGYKYCGSGDKIMFLAYHVVSCDHVFKGLRHFMGESFL